MKKNISKIQWFGSEIENGKAKAPVISPDSMSHLEGLNQGEFYICNADEDPAIFIRTNRDNVVAFKLAADVDMEALKKVFLRKDQNDTNLPSVVALKPVGTNLRQSLPLLSLRMAY